ncbi:hypothetical protein [Streptomyces roseolus]
MTDTAPPSLATVIKQGTRCHRIEDNGRLHLTFTPEAFDALTEILDTRSRHRPVDPDVVRLVGKWRSCVCNARSFWQGPGNCFCVVDLPGQRCEDHLAIEQVHPDAWGAVDQLSPRAKRLFDHLVERRYRFLAQPYTSHKYLAHQVGVSESTLTRATAELTERHIIWRENHRTFLHPAIAYFDGYGSHQKALQGLRADRRQAWQHLEPTLETAD